MFQTASLVAGKVKVDTVIAKLPNETYVGYVNFFSRYHFPGYTDNRLPDTTGVNPQGMDGILIIGFYYGDIKKQFRLWSPYHDTASMSLFKMTLGDIDKYLKTDDNKKYLTWLKMYAE